MVYTRHQRHQEKPHSNEGVATMSGIGEPFFTEESSAMGVKNVTAQLGLTTYLHCKVNNLNGKTVSNTDYCKSLLRKLSTVDTLVMYKLCGIPQCGHMHNSKVLEFGFIIFKVTLE